jgi:protein involved in polysaccharide export with SLBB domain
MKQMRITGIEKKNTIACTFFIFCIYFSSTAQGITRDFIDKAVQNLRDGNSYNDITEMNSVQIPEILNKIDESQIPDVKNLAKSINVQDKYLDENEYYVGPGDIFMVHIWGKMEKSYTLNIDNEGQLYIPLKGIINIKGKTLNETKELIRQEILQLYRKKIELIVSLSNIRQFKVYIIGDVMHPGGYLANGMTRISDIIEFAGGISERGKYRNIKITNDFFETRYADLAAFMHSREISKNPYIREGDIIHVEPLTEFINIQGFVNYPDTYSVCVDDKLRDILLAAGGFSRGADKNKILIFRFLSDNDSLTTYQISSSQADTFQIERDDRIYVCGITKYRHHLEVIINGEVRYPGVYPIRRDKTRLMEIISMAGGLTDDAFLKGSKIIRKIYPSVGEKEFARVKAMPAISLSELERSYLKTKLIEERGLVSMDFEKLFSNESNIYNIILRDKDEITIARKSLSIKVSGSVVSPGLISFKENKDYKYYINQAGGFNTRAKKRMVQIIKGGTEIVLEPNKVEKLEAGDAIWIPEKEYRDKVQITKDILTILSSIASVVTSTITVISFVQQQ